MSPDILRELFIPKISSYNLRRSNTFKRCQVHSVYHGTESLSFLGPKIWDLVPLELKQLESLEVFKLKIKKWIPFECPCRFCRTYMQQVGFLEAVKLIMIIAVIIFIIYVVYTIIDISAFADFFFSIFLAFILFI